MYFFMNLLIIWPQFQNAIESFVKGKRYDKLNKE